MPFKTPLAGSDRRVAALRGTLLAASFLGLIASAPAWVNTRGFPLVPIGSWIPILPSPADKVLYGAMLAALVAALWFYRPAVIFFLSASLFAFFEDQNRGQPWLYMYWVMLLLSLAAAPASLAACRIGLGVVYAWGGIQKLNPKFFKVVPEWFVAPALKWNLPATLIELLKIGIATAPFLELAIAILLWVPRCRRAAIWAVVFLHGVSLVFLSPLGHNYNWVVWPWNLAMIALAWTLFSNSRLFQVVSGAVPAKPSASKTRSARPGLTTIPGTTETLRQLLHSRPASIIVLLFALLPILSFFGRWDSYFSFSLYAENAARANTFVTQAFADRLPQELRKYVQPFPQAYDPQHQGPLIFAFDPWCYEELHIPPIPEVRNFRGIFQHLRIYAPQPHDLRMVIGPRSGPVIFLQGDETELLRRQ